MKNLDLICIEYGQKLYRKKKDVDFLRKSLRILKEDGIYAMFLWLESQNKELREKLSKIFTESIIRDYLLSNSDKFPTNFEELIDILKIITQDIDKLFFFMDIIERILVYALYHSKII